MGAYLSEPNLNKDSLDGESEKVGYGASSMQGWRLEQEDAHNSIIDFDSKTSFFAVYDGHGGAEVAAYCAKYLPDFLKTLEEYEKNDLEAALKKLFLKFDESLLSENATKELTAIRDKCSKEGSLVDEASETKEVKNESAEKSDEDEAESSEQKASSVKPNEDCDNIKSETAALYDEACMPLEEVLKRYTNTEKKMKKVLDKTKSANSATLSPMLNAPGSSASKKSRLNRDKVIPTTPLPKKSAAELDKQEEIDIKEIKKNGHVELDGSEVNCEIDFDEASNLCELTDSQKEGDSANVTATQEESTTPEIKKEVEPETVKAKNNLLLSGTETPNTKQARHKLREEEIKLSPIRNKSLSSSSLFEEISAKEEAIETNGVDKSDSSKTNAKETINEENKENDASNISNNSEQSKSIEKEETPSKKSAQKSDSDLIAKLIAGVINKKLRQTSKRNQPKQSDDKAADLAEDDDDDFDANYTESEDEDENSSAEESGNSEDYESTDDDDYEEDDEDDEEDDEGSENYPAGTGMSRPGYDSGCTAVVALLRDNKKLYVANAGDSRCVVCRDGKAVEMSFDHKPEDDIERERVEKAGGVVTKDGRINNGLNLSRAIGDHTYKQNKELTLSEQMITSLPDVLTLDIDAAKDKFMVLACDGIWNFMSSQEVCDYIQERIEAKYSKLSQICEELFMHCLAPNTEGDGTGCDNMTCIIVTFEPFQKFELKINKNDLKRCLETNNSNQAEDTNSTKKLKQEETILA